METKIKLTGPKAIAALVVIVGVVALQFLARQQTLQTEAVDQIKMHLSAEYARQHLPELQRATQNVDFEDVDETRIEEMMRQISTDNIEIVEIAARGRRGEYVARVEIEVDGLDPPDGRRIRYFKMTHSTLAGWRVIRDTSKWSYYLAF
jgi:hypothetical protein